MQENKHSPVPETQGFQLGSIAGVEVGQVLLRQVGVAKSLEGLQDVPAVEDRDR